MKTGVFLDFGIIDYGNYRSAFG